MIYLNPKRTKKKKKDEDKASYRVSVTSTTSPTENIRIDSNQPVRFIKGRISKYQLNYLLQLIFLFRLKMSTWKRIFSYNLCSF